MNERIEGCVRQLESMKFETLIDMTFGDLLDAQAQRFPDRDCLISPHKKQRYTYAQFRDECNRVARGFLAMGIKKGDNVAIWATNYTQWVTTMFATAKIGAVMVTVNTNYKRFELEYLLRQSDSMTLIMSEGVKDNIYSEHLYSLCPSLPESAPGQLCCAALPFLKNVIYLESEKKPGMFGWEELYAMAETVAQVQLDQVQATLNKHDVVNMQYTSGTTGFPKGVMLSHYSVINNGKAIGDRKKLTELDRECIPVPLFHCFGCVLGVTSCVTHGSAMILVDRFHPERVMEAVQWERCTSLLGVPTMFISILNHPAFSQYDFSTMRTGIMAGSPCPVEVMKRVAAEMHMPEIVISFGMTESSPVTTMTSTDDPLEKRVSTVGRLQPNMEAMIIDPETGAPCPVGTPGEFVTRGYQVMSGYYNMPEATAQTIDKDGWLHTGDLLMVDEEGYYKVTGRIKDMIIRGGENIYPREIEEFLYTHNEVKDVQVIGVPDKKYGEEVLAYIIPHENCKTTEEEFVEFVRAGLSKFKAPRYVKFIDEFPMTASGKIQKYKLRERAVEELHLEDAASIVTA